MNKRVLFFSLSAVVSLAGAVAACSSSTATTDPPAEEAGVKEGGTGDGGKDSAAVGTDSGTTGDPDKACAAMGTKLECGTCCITAHKTGYNTFQTALLACACKGTGADGGAPCATDCAATLCASTPKTADTKCNTCLHGSINQGGACQDSIQTTCTADPDCLAEQKCVTPCTTKP